MIAQPRPEDLLDWYIETGADEAIGDTPVDRFAASKAGTQRAAPPAGAKPAAPRAPAAPPAATATREIAAACDTVEALVAAIQDFDGCALKETATNTVIADGNAETARVMFVGEAPGAAEDRRGLPFVGPAGQLLDRMLAAIGMDRATAYISNMIFWRPPGNRTPTADEIAMCLAFTQRHIELVAPEVLVPIGGISAKALLGRAEGITRLRGTWHRYQSPGLAEPIPAIATFHSAYLLRQPAKKREVWRDLLAIKARLDEADAA